MSNNGKDVYFVAVKAFVRKNGKLLIMKDNFGDWDLPGGRIKEHEFEVPFEAILQRKMSEELGRDAIVAFGSMPVVLLRHERIEQCEGNPKVRILGLGYEGVLQKGEINLSPRHTEMLWVSPSDFQPEKFFTGGWLKGVREYLALCNR